MTADVSPHTSARPAAASSLAADSSLVAAPSSLAADSSLAAMPSSRVAGSSLVAVPSSRVADSSLAAARDRAAAAAGVTGARRRARAVAGVSVVVPTVGRPSLLTLLAALDVTTPERLEVEIVVVDDRTDQNLPLNLPPGITVLSGPGRGPAAARNLGWRAARHEWIAFLDDDVLPAPGWWEALAEDLTAAADGVGGVQGNLDVPLPAGRRPTDWERVTAALADGSWLTADMAYRRPALLAVNGFDERFPRAFREDAELAYRVRAQGWTLRRGARRVTHPVRPESPWVSIRTQRGNADDALLHRLYGRDWRTLLDIPPGRRARHAAITAAAAAAVLSAATAGIQTMNRNRPSAVRPGPAARRAGLVAIGVASRGLTARGAAPGLGVRGPAARGAGGRGAAALGPGVRAFAARGAGVRALAARRAGGRGWAVAALVFGAAWAVGTAEFAAARIRPGPRDRKEVATMLATSAVIPPLAVGHWLRGWLPR